MSIHCRLGTYWTVVGLTWTGTRTVLSSFATPGTLIVTARPAELARVIVPGSAASGVSVNK